MDPTGRSRRRRRVRLWGALAVAGAAVAAPAVAHAVIRRRLRAPEAPRWGRTHRYGGHCGQVVYQELGAGRPLVLLHAFGPGFDAGQWRWAAEALAPRFRIYAPDLPGWGRSAAPVPHPEAYLAALADFLAVVVREPAVVVAAGLTAGYAVRLAAEHPERVSALALVAPSGASFPSPPTPQDTGVSSWLQMPRWLQIPGWLRVPLLRDPVLDALTSRAALGRFLRRHAYAAPERVDAAVLEHHYRVSHLPAHRRALAAWWRGELELPPGAGLEALQVPIWICRGGAYSAPAATADRFYDLLERLPAGSEIHTFEGSRTLPHAEQPLAFSRALAGFLDQLQRP
jgi:pimeloyl-ACP methyl ester carboxylesterase